jgi:hypothetical protein
MSDDASLHLSDRLPFPRQFASKIDWWLAVLLIAPVVLVGALLLAGLSSFWVLAVTLAPQALVIWILARTFYVVAEDALLVRSGPFRWSIPLESIRALSATRNPLSSPALSLDRIAVEHTGGRLMVSPRNRAGFVRAVVALAPAVSVSGLPGATGSAADDKPESAFNTAAIVPIIALAVAGLAFGGWQVYRGTRAPDAIVSGDTLSISGLYSTTVSRQDVVRVALEDRVDVGRKLQGFSGGRYLRGFFEVDGLGPCRVFVVRNATPFLVVHTRTQPLVINFDEPARTRALYDALIRAWRIGRPE